MSLQTVFNNLEDYLYNIHNFIFRESWRRIGVYRTKNNNTLINMLNKTQEYIHWEVGQPSTYVYEDSVVLTKQGNVPA